MSRATNLEQAACLFAVVVLASLGAPRAARAFVQPTYHSSTDLVGLYAFHGTEPDGSPETPGVARISALAPNVYLLVEESQGTLASVSRCLRDGDVLACGWSAGPTTDSGAAVLRRGSDGAFHGLLLPVGALVAERVRSVNPTPTLALEVVDGGVPRLVGGTVLSSSGRGFYVGVKPAARGTSLLDGDVLAIGFGGGTRMVGTVVFRIFGRTLLGKWVDTSRDGVGTETLERL